MKATTAKRRLLKVHIDEDIFWESKAQAAKEKKPFNQYVEESLRVKLPVSS